MLCFPSQFNDGGKRFWDIFLKARAVDCQCYMVGCTQARDTANPELFQSLGESRVCNPFGKYIGDSAEELTNFEERVIYAEVDLNDVEKMR